MILTCNSVEEFLEEVESQIKQYGKNCVYLKTIRLSITDRPVAESATTRREDIAHWVVGLQASTVMDLGDDGQFLVQVGVDCGMDIRNASNKIDGTRTAERQKEVVKSFCTRHGLRVGPGVIQV